jgi:hypothetical protein
VSHSREDRHGRQSRSTPPDAIYIIRHGEQPAEPASKKSAPEHHAPEHHGVDFHGHHNEHSLLPRGWQRSGALAALFDPAEGPLRPGLRVPGMLVAPSYGDRSKNALHRTHQTISGMSDRLGIEIASDFAKGQESELAAALTTSGPETVLICWDHAHIPALASALALAHGTVIPEPWPDDRYDVIWTFTRASDHKYSFAQVPQLLLSGDTDIIIAAG